MSFSVSDRNSLPAVQLPGVSRFKQTTALIGATLLFCMPLAQAYADTVYYNYEGPEDSPEPQTGGVWADSNSHDNWIERDEDTGEFIPGNDRFRSGDDVHFLSTTDTLIEIGIIDTVDPNDIVIEDGTFEFNAIDGDSAVEASTLTVLSGSRLNLDVDTVIDPGASGSEAAVSVAGTLLVRVDRELEVLEDSIDVVSSGDLIVGGTIRGDVSINDTGTISFGTSGSIIGRLDINRTDAVVNGNVRELWVNEGGSATFGGAQSRALWAINNYGTLSLRAGTYSGALYNGGDLNLAENVGIATTSASAIVAYNYADGTILADGGDRTLTVNGTLDNHGTLAGDAADSTLTVEATRIVVRDGSVFTGNVVLSGAIDNEAEFDLAYAPQLGGTFTNRAGATASVTNASDAVDGNQQDFINTEDAGVAASLNIDAGSLTNLAELQNNGGSVRVSEGAELGATTITHNAGIFTSAGTLIGAVTANADAQIEDTVNGSFTVADGTTTVTGALDFGATSGGGLLAVGTDGELVLSDGITVTTANLTSTGAVNLGTGGVVDGDLSSGGTLIGTGEVTGDLIFTGNGTFYGGTSLTVDGAVVNDRSGSVLVSQITGITFDHLINRSTAGALLINQARTVDITNEAGALLEVNQAVTGTVTTFGATNLRHNIVGALVVADGLTRIGVPTLGLDTPVRVGGPDGLTLRIEEGGELRVIEGDLTSTGDVRALGKLDLRPGRVLTAANVYISGSDGATGLNASYLSGQIDGALTVTPDGTATLDGVTVTGTVVNNNIILGNDDSGGSVVMQNRFVNRGTASFGSETNVAEIRGQLVNQEGAYADIIGNVTASTDHPGVVINSGELHLTGNVAGTVNNSGGILELTGDMGRLINDEDGNATITGDVGTAGALAYWDVVNRGDLILTGNVANSLRNFGTARVTGAIGGNAVSNEAGQLYLSGSVGQDIQTNGADAVVHIAGDTTAADLINQGTTNIQTSATLGLAAATVNNGSGARLTVNGTLENTDPAAAFGVQNDQGGVVAVTSTGTLDGDLTNNGVANIGGNITGDIVNNDNSPAPADAGVLNLWTVANVDGAVTNSGVVNVTGGDPSSDGTDYVVVAGGVTNATGGTVNVTGALDADMLNQAGADLNLDGGKIAGVVTNEAGADILSTSGYIVGEVNNYGTFTVDLDTFVEGDFNNFEDALVTQTGGISTLTVDGVFTNDGIISAGDFSEIRIATENFVNDGTLEGSVVILGDVSNNGRIIYSSDTTLTDDLESAGTVRVWATVTGDGDNAIVNNGLFDVSRGGELLNVATVENNDVFVIEEGSRVQTGSFTNNAGTLANAGTIEGDVSNMAGAELTSTGVIDGNLYNEGIAELSGTITGDLETADAPGTTTDIANVVGDLAIGGNLDNGGSLLTAAGTELAVAGSFTNQSGGDVVANGTVVAANVVNGGTMALRSGLQGNLQNNGSAQVSGTVTGDVANSGTAGLSGRILGMLTNDGDTSVASDRIDLTGNLRVGAVVNSGGALVVANDRTLRVDNNLRNTGDGRLAIDGNVVVGGTLLNDSSEQLVMASGSRLTGNLQNETSARLNGTIDGSVLNRGPAGMSGRITGTLINEGARLETTGDLVVVGAVVNRPQPLTPGTPAPGSMQQAPGAPTTLIVNAATTMTAGGGLTNEAGATVRVAGQLNGDVVNRGLFRLENRLQGDLNNQGTAFLVGEIDGNLTYAEGSTLEISHASRPHELVVTGIFDSFNDFAVQEEDTLQVGRYINRAENELTVAGNMSGLIENDGSLVGIDGGQIGSLTNQGSFDVGGSFALNGSMTNDGTVNMADNGVATDVLTINGSVSGAGTYALNLDMNANGGAGASDLVVVRGGAVTGSILLSFDDETVAGGATDASKRILVFDVDGSQGSANSFTYSAEGLPAASERVIYSVIQDGASGDLYMTDAINPALGALSGNLALTQSLIGSVVNRPSSPFVPGLAGGAGEKPCGAGAWARALAGRASATGQTSSGDFSIASSIEASYRGLQFGGDLACFEGSVSGWNVAMGVMGGVNDGTTTQPVYVNDPTDPSQLTDVLGSINNGDFRQLYGGVYATASRDRWFLDLQMRRERTSFTIDNQPVGADNLGLQLRDSGFDSNATTISGAVSYAYTLPREGWLLVPTAGFAFSNLSVDPIYFEDGSELRIEDSKNRVGFIGGTVSKTFVNQERKSIINTYGTATIYKDFAPETASVFVMRDSDGTTEREDGLTSSNLGTYGELSFGVNYSKVLEAGSAGKPRQFNASVRVDGRTGDVLDSYGVTAQIRLQF
ncbi:hypothetical protein [Paracoccus tegillarcae]|uniref:Autotransporter domain-containing protein n=1 Tax=Paracoccus tegillarcae TaxID=1529068 RepID=A0A2K9EEX4_9RHOB|nr:hypothetical protein [Paracoccus tegillarcae]AUH33518.1 hypothetical protein CUV01_09075 [Paracoccus tegillarcae]